MDHRQLVVRLLIVDRHTCRLGEHDQEQCSRRHDAALAGESVPSGKSARDHARMNGASVRLANVISRLAAIAANPERDASAESTRRSGRGRAAAPLQPRRCRASRRRAPATRVANANVAQHDPGAATTIAELPAARTASFPHSFCRSRYGWTGAGPGRPCSLARMVRMRPWSSGASATSTANWIAALTVPPPGRRGRRRRRTRGRCATARLARCARAVPDVGRRRPRCSQPSSTRSRVVTW